MRKFIMCTSWSRRTAPTQRHRPCLWWRWTRPPWRTPLLPRPWRSSSSSRLCPCTWCQLRRGRQMGMVTRNVHGHTRKMRNLCQTIRTRRVTLTSFASRLHHHATSDCVEGVRDDASSGGDSLGDHPADDDVRVLGVWQHTWMEKELSREKTHKLTMRNTQVTPSRCAHL